MSIKFSTLWLYLFCQTCVDLVASLFGMSEISFREEMFVGIFITVAWALERIWPEKDME